MTVATRERIAEKLPRLEIGATTGMVEHLRQVKDKEELALIRQAVQVAEKSFAVIRAGLRPEQTEKQIGDALEHQFRLFGGEGPAFAPIVAVGPRAALPHAKLTDRRVGNGDILLVDWGAQWRLYKSDLTRVLVTGKISTKLRRVYEVVLGHRRGPSRPFDPAYRRRKLTRPPAAIAEAGLDRRFNHGIGHGLGLEVHESPRMPARAPRRSSRGWSLPSNLGCIFRVGAVSASKTTYSSPVTGTKS